MKILRKIGFCASLVFALSVVGAAAQEPSFSAPAEPEVVPGEFIVKYTADVDFAMNALALEEKGIQVVDTLPLIGAQVIHIEDTARELSLQAAAASLPGVEYIEPVYRLFALVDPNDPQYPQQWGYPKIKAPQAWDVLNSAADVVVAVIDTGVDYNHPDIAANMWKNPFEIPGNGTDDDNNGIVDDVHGANFVDPATTGDPLDDNNHGTHVSGTIAGSHQQRRRRRGVGVESPDHGAEVPRRGRARVLPSGAIRAIEYGIKMGCHHHEQQLGRWRVLPGAQGRDRGRRRRRHPVRRGGREHPATSETTTT